MTDVIRTIIVMSVSGGVTALILFALKPLVRNRLPKTAQYYLWLVVFAAFLVPFSKLVVLPAADENSPLAVAPQRVVDRFVITAEEEKTLVQAVRSGYLPDSVNSDYHYIQEVKQTQSPISSAVTVFLIIYPFGAAAVLLFSIISYTRYRRKIMRRNAAFATGTDCKTPVYRNPLAATPMLIGLFRPVIVLPDREFTDEQLRAVLLHELTHLRQRDILIKWLSVLACSLHWFNPVAWLARREIDRACELACDEAVIRKLDADGRQSYGDTLIAVAADSKMPRTVLSTTMCERKKSLKERLGAIMKHKKTTRLAIILSAALIVVAGIGAILLGAGSKNSEPKAQTLDIDGVLVSITLPDGVEYNRDFTAEAVNAESFWTDDLLPELVSGNKMAIFQQHMTGSMTNWGDGYTVVSQNTDSGSGTTLVYYREDYIAENGGDLSQYIALDELGDAAELLELYGDGEGRRAFFKQGILAYNIPLKAYVAIEFNRGAVTDEQLAEIAQSVSITGTAGTPAAAATATPPPGGEDDGWTFIDGSWAEWSDKLLDADNTALYDEKFLEADFDLDGLTDYIRLRSSDTDTPGEWYTAYLEIGFGGAANPLIRTDWRFHSFEKLGRLDVSGDGAYELLLMFDTHGSGGAGTHEIYIVSKGAEITMTTLSEAIDAGRYNVSVTFTAAKTIRLTNALGELVSEFDIRSDEYDILYGGDELYKSQAGNADGFYDFGVVSYRGKEHLMIRQYVWGIAHGDHIADILSLLSYDNGRFTVTAQIVEVMSDGILLPDKGTPPLPDFAAMGDHALLLYASASDGAYAEGAYAELAGRFDTNAAGLLTVMSLSSSISPQASANVCAGIAGEYVIEERADDLAAILGSVEAQCGGDTVVTGFCAAIRSALARYTGDGDGSQWRTVRLGMTHEDVSALLGAPSSTGSGFDWWFYDEWNLSILFLADSNYSELNGVVCLISQNGVVIAQSWADAAPFAPADIHNLVSAELWLPDGGVVRLADAQSLRWLETNFGAAAELGYPADCAGSPALYMTRADGVV
ncbi:MAG: M56 family metallopeptidase, partial [Oscillospiraceae bacterium]|nr:M56 family metallopeptidase [Oscillospiraceae bacterium]